MTVDLRFSGGLGPQPGGAVVLLFGGTLPPPVIAPPTTLRAAYSAPWRRAGRGPSRSVALPWGRAAGVLPGLLRAPWGTAAPLAGVVGLPWVYGRPIERDVRTGWHGAARHHREYTMPWHQALPLTRSVAGGFGAGIPRRLDVVADWQRGLPAAHITSTHWSTPTPVEVRVEAGFGAGVASARSTAVPWHTGAPVVSLGGPWSALPIPQPPVVPCWLPEPGEAVTLLFREALTGLAALVFACRAAALRLVPIRRVYMVTNVTSLVRVDGGVAIPCFGFSLSLDVDSWAWGFSASLPAEALALIEPSVAGEPVELAATVNGTEFRLIAESLSRERVFGQSGVRVQGRGKTAVLDAPYSPLTTFSEADPLTSQQLLDQALPIGWTCAWGLTAWLVPGAVWSHQGTAITAAVAIAAAGGGYVQPHASASSISVLPRYPVVPWSWGGVTPDLELPSAVTVREAIEWTEKTRYNGVYVSGTTTAGVLRLVKRTGTAGDVLAQMVTDPLITHVDAARQRGIPVLADTGRIAHVTLRLPVLPETDVIRPGQFVRYTDGATVRIGLVRSVAVDVAGHEVWQTIRVETHVN